MAATVKMQRGSETLDVYRNSVPIMQERGWEVVSKSRAKRVEAQAKPDDDKDAKSA